MTKVKSLNIDKMAQTIHRMDNSVKVMDAKKALKLMLDVVETGLDSNQEVKFGDLFKLIPEWYEPRKQYNKFSKDGKGEVIELPERMLVKMKPLKRMQQVQRDSWKEDEQ